MPGMQAGVRPDQVQGLQCGCSPPLCWPQQPPAAGQHAVMHGNHALRSYALRSHALHSLELTLVCSVELSDCKTMSTACGLVGCHYQIIDAHGITHDGMCCFTCCMM